MGPAQGGGVARLEEGASSNSIGRLIYIPEWDHTLAWLYEGIKGGDLEKQDIVDLKVSNKDKVHLKYETWNSLGKIWFSNILNQIFLLKLFYKKFFFYKTISEKKIMIIWL